MADVTIRKLMDEKKVPISDFPVKADLGLIKHW